MLRRGVILLGAALLALATPFITPAWACGRGAYDFHFRRAASDDAVGHDGAREPGSSDASSSRGDGSLHDVLWGLGALALLVLLAVGVVKWQGRRQ